MLSTSRVHIAGDFIFVGCLLVLPMKMSPNIHLASNTNWLNARGFKVTVTSHLYGSWTQKCRNIIMDELWTKVWVIQTWLICFGYFWKQVTVFQLDILKHPGNQRNMSRTQPSAVRLLIDGQWKIKTNWWRCHPGWRLKNSSYLLSPHVSLI